MVLIITSLLWFALFAGIGFLRSASRLWSFVDVVYYPAVAIGVIVLFFEAAPLRNISTIQDQERETLAAKRDWEALRPETNGEVDDSRIVREHARLLDVLIQHAEVCEGYSSTDCLVRRRAAPQLSALRNELSNYHDQSDAFRVCQAARDFFESSKSSRALSGFLVDVAEEHLASGLERDFFSMDYDGARNYALSVSETLNSEAATIAAVVFDDVDERNTMIEFYAAETDILTSVMGTFSACLRAPESIRNGEFEEWREEMTRIAETASTLEEQKESARNSLDDVTDLRIFRASVWPYILIFVLGLKFGKAIASARQAIR